ncbi:CDP-diacylglycerol--glycerol-3-phosphate 3-phosphatidyltransferase [Estrella lausannensis]|uniref:CDP-diacylglycerol--glycerol-3-phosphate 3-phosphatidyltransferase n=1 Tax=Estrella lausannensis TaxID=483423 RepID=A0A0H5DQN7_9BACT|nr:CDP-diacylglycerol--glycerol-3-phosphate 3-phosphatidyltransferase [Estrella lausannensis]CRX38408.1 CDP-diacylglycerol-glycerol-3-phosphate 3-phosphatidyltransferase [Estrella lausannensis]
MGLANFLTLTRVLLSPFFLIIYVHYSFLGLSQESMPYALLILLVLLELSDAFDGYYARRYGEVSDLGKILDPMADSVARISMFLAFTYPPIDIPVLFVFLIIWRDSIVSTLRTICALRGVALAARKSGKIKSVAQAATAIFIVLLMLLQSRGTIALSQLQTISFWIALAAVSFTLLTAVDYISSNRVHIKKILSFKRRKQKNLKT